MRVTLSPLPATRQVGLGRCVWLGSYCLACLAQCGSHKGHVRRLWLLQVGKKATKEQKGQLHRMFNSISSVVHRTTLCL